MPTRPFPKLPRSTIVCSESPILLEKLLGCPPQTLLQAAFLLVSLCTLAVLPALAAHTLTPLHALESKLELRFVVHQLPS